MSERKTDDATLIEALRLLSRKIKDDEGVIGACLAEAAARLEKLVEERRWVSVDEKLPSDNVAVLVWGPCCGEAEMVWRERGKWHLSFVGTYIPDSTYTHWQPLPPGPEATNG